MAVTYGKKFRLKRKGHSMNGKIVRYRYVNKNKKTRKLVLDNDFYYRKRNKINQRKAPKGGYRRR
jgi:hypothetical protein